MENIKAFLTVGDHAYPVLVRSDWKNTDFASVAVRINWDYYKAATDFVKEGIFDSFIKDIGYTSYLWDFMNHRDHLFYVSKEDIVTDPESNNTADESDNTSTYLTKQFDRIKSEFEEEGYTLVRVEHSIDMYEGTITLRYKKEEN